MDWEKIKEMFPFELYQLYYDGVLHGLDIMSDKIEMESKEKQEANNGRI